MNVHILFGPAEKMSISLDDEVQFRCAGYVQAEIERYAETLAETDEEEQDDDNEDEEIENTTGDEVRSNAGDESKKNTKAKKAKMKTRIIKEGSSVPYVLNDPFQQALYFSRPPLPITAA